MKKPTKAVIAAAGLGTRFLPQSKAMPKEMLPIIDKPVIQIVVEQLAKSGVQDIIIVTGSTKRAIEDHFDRSDELENELIARGKPELAEQIKAIAELANFIYIRQKGSPKGNALPLLNAAHLLNNEPFYMFFADDFFRSEIPHAQQLCDVYMETGCSVISLIEVSKEDTKHYGIASVSEKLNDRTFKIDNLTEKPGPEHALSNYASVGGALLTPDILSIVEEREANKSGEIVLGDSINKLAAQGKVYGKFIEGVFHDAGDKSRYLHAVVDHALCDPKLGPDFRKYLYSRLEQE